MGTRLAWQRNIGSYTKKNHPNFDGQNSGF